VNGRRYLGSAGLLCAFVLLVAGCTFVVVRDIAGWKTLVVYGILGPGALGYVVALSMAIRLHIWLGRKENTWPRMILRTIIFCLSGLGLLYFISLGTASGTLGGWPLGVLNVGAAIFLMAVPWRFALSLHQWRMAIDRWTAISPQVTTDDAEARRQAAQADAKRGGYDDD